MLKRVIAIKNVGTFRDSRAYSGLGNTDLGRLTLVHAENGRGKTTLCAILRSLRSGDASLIMERKTLDSADAPHVHLLMDPTPIEFKNGNWGSNCPHLEIFDADFIASNVYSGDVISHDHKTNLCRVVLGAKGVALVEAYHAADALVKKTGDKATEIKKEIEKLLPTGITIEQFVKLPQDPKIDAQIAAKDAEMAVIADAENIGKKSLLSCISIPSVPADLATQLATTIEGISLDAEEKVQRHIDQHNMKARGQAWLAEGLTFATNECPFCDQPLVGSAIIEAIKSFFSAAYGEFQAKLRSLRQSVETSLGNAALLGVQKSTASNATLSGFWAKHIEDKAPQISFDTQIQPSVQELHTALMGVVAVKLASPLEAVAFTPECEAALKRLASLKGEVDAYNASVDQYNVKAQAIKDSSAKKTTSQVQQEIKTLKLTKTRYTDHTVVALAAVLDALKAKVDAEKAKIKARSYLDTYNESVIATYRGSVNELLEAFGAGFRLAVVKVEYIGRKPRAAYSFEIRGVTVEPGTEKTAAGIPAFRNTLSSGDRSTLALAFFIAQLRNRSDLADLIAVFDDPFTSLDSFRQTWTCCTIRKLAKECEQTIVLSHSLEFLRLLATNCESGLVKTLKIDRQKKEDCHIIELNLDDETAPIADEDLVTLRGYHLADSNDKSKTIRAIRPLLENYIRRQAPDDCPSGNGWLGTFLGKIKAAADGTTLAVIKPDYDVLDELNGYTSPYAHDSGQSPPINEAELQVAVKKTLKVIGRE